MKNTVTVNVSVASLGKTFDIDRGYDYRSDFYYSTQYEVPDGWEAYRNVYGDLYLTTPSGQSENAAKFFKVDNDCNCYFYDDWDNKWYRLKHVEGSDGPVTYITKNY